jgi:hypothetical protein
LNASLSLSPGGAVTADVVGHAVVRASPPAVQALRQNPVPPGLAPLPPTFLKHADEQTVVGLAAVLRASAEHGPAVAACGDWGVFSAPRFLGRIQLAASVMRYRVEGAWGMSPHIIPHRSLHAVSGTISQALKMHGPNLGVGGGPAGPTEVFQAAAAALADGALPGLWVVLTGWDPEIAPDAEGRPTNEPTCAALAVALTPARPGWAGRQLCVAPGAEGGRGPRGCLTLEALLAAWPRPGSAWAPLSWGLDGGGVVRLEPGTAESIRAEAG